MTNPMYNLVDEGWIPCVMYNNAQAQLLSLRETLHRAPEIVEIVDPSPLVTVALHRLLLAILHRCYGPARVDDWRKLWAAGQWDERVDAYLEQWRHRFELFDPLYPFYQVSDIPVQYATPISHITPELASGNNATLWDHTSHATAAAFTPDQAARSLVALQAFALGGLVSVRKDEQEHKSANAAPLAGSAVALVRGPSLRATLILNLHRYDGEEEPFFAHEDDAPAWERSRPTRPEDREVTGYLDLLTWQSRQVQLYHEQDSLMVRQVAILKGNQFPRTGYRYGKETMLAFRPNPEAKGEQDPWPPLAFREERVVWRDSSVLFQSLHEQRTRPRTLDWLAQLVDRGVLQRDATTSLDLYGLASDQAKPLFWRHERLPLSLQYLRDDLLQEQLRVALQWAEQGKAIINRGLQLVAERGIAPYAVAEGIGKEDKARAKDLVKGWGAERQYWARLDLPFRALLQTLPQDYDTKGAQPCYGSNEMPRWGNTVRRAARESFSEVIRSLDTSGRWLHAVATAEPAFWGQLNRVGITQQAADEQGLKR